MEQNALAYQGIDIIPRRGLLRTPVEDMLELDAFSNVINMRYTERPGLWIARDGQRGLRLYIDNGGIEPDTNSWYLRDDVDYGNYAICEIPFGYIADNVAQPIRYMTWSLWLPRHQDGSGAWRDAVTRFGTPYNQTLFAQTRDPSDYAAYNPTEQYTTCMVLVQRSQSLLRQVPFFAPDWLDNYLYNDRLLWGKIYCLMLPSLPDTCRYQQLRVVAGWGNVVPDNAVGWVWKWVLSADWSWQSPMALYHTSASADTPHFPWGGVISDAAGAFGGVRWDDGDYTVPIYWSGRAVTLGNYTVLTHPGMLQEYFIDTVEDDVGAVHGVYIDDDAQIPDGLEYSRAMRKDYLIGDIVLYDNKSVTNVEQRELQDWPVVVQENSVGRVGGDILEIDLRLHEENSVERGVETGVALYRFYADVSYALAEDITFDKSIYELLKTREVGTVVEGWYSPNSVWSTDTGSGYFAKTHTQFKSSELKDKLVVDENLFTEDYSLFTGHIVRSGITYDGFNLEAWNDLQHKALAAFLSLYRWTEEIFPTYTWLEGDKDRLQLHPMFLFSRLDRRDGNNWLYSKTIWGEHRRPFICGWTRLDHYGDLLTKQEGQDVTSSTYEESAPAWSNAFIVDNDNRHIVSGVADTVPFPDLLKKPILYNPFQTSYTIAGDEESGFAVLSRKDIAADVFVWGDMKVRYYPCSGRIRGMYIETFYDRVWTKLRSGSTRVYDVSQPNEDNPKTLAPVAGWSYRFVYEYHDGTFSAPSPVYQAPTLLFSPLNDDHIVDLAGEYRRPIAYSGDGTEAIWHSSLQPYNTPPIKLFFQFPTISTFEYSDNDGSVNVPVPGIGSGGLARLHALWRQMCRALYAEEHLYYDVDIPDTVDSTNYYKYLDRLTASFTLIQVWDDSGTHALSSLTPIGEGICIADTFLNPKEWDDNTFVYRLIKAYLRVPFIPDNSKASYNSIFSPPGKYGGYYRMTYHRHTMVQDGYREWDYLSREGEYIYFPNQCLLNGHPCGTVEAYIVGDPSSLTTYQRRTSGSTKNVPLYMPYVPFKGNATNLNDVWLVLPSWVLRRVVRTMPWSADANVVMPSVTLSPSGPPVEWLRWAQNANPCCEVENSYIQICWEGESQTTSPMRWPAWRYIDDNTWPAPNAWVSLWVPSALTQDYFQNSGGPPYTGVGGEELPHGYDVQPEEHRNRQGWFEMMYHYHPTESPKYPGVEYYATATKDISLRNLTTACGLWNVLRAQSATGSVEKYVYVNIICPLWDKNNEGDYEHWMLARSAVVNPQHSIPFPLRVPSILRYIKDAASVVSYSSFKAGVPAEVTARMVLAGKVPLRIATSRFSDSAKATLVSFAGTRKTYYGHYVVGKPDSSHQKIVIDFAEAEREGRIANIPHVKSRWAPVVTGHALSNIRTRRQKHKLHREVLYRRWLLEPKSTGAITAIYANAHDADYLFHYHYTINLYSFDRATEPHWMLPDGVLCSQWSINNDGSVTPAGNNGRNLHLRENPRRIPPLRYNVLRDINPFIYWAHYRMGADGGGSRLKYQFMHTQWVPPAGLTSYSGETLNGEPNYWPSLAYFTPRPYYDYPAWGISTDGPLANASYPPTPWRTRLNWFWKYVPLQAYGMVQGWSVRFEELRHHWWCRPYWVAEPKCNFLNIGIPNVSNFPSLFSNYPSDSDLRHIPVVVRFPVNDQGQYIYPTEEKKATIIAAFEKEKLEYSFNKLLPQAFILSYGITDLWYDKRVAGVTSLDCVVYLQGHRVLYPEQFTMYYTAKMLFDAPRLGLWFRKNSIPPRVKRIHIYRTRHIDDNQWHPDEFGYVGSVDAQWEYDSEGRRINDLYFFDNVPDSKLDMGDDISRFEALDRGLSSVTATVLSERVYYGNIRESYLPVRTTAFAAARSSRNDYLGWGICRYKAINFAATMQNRVITGELRPDGKAYFPGAVLVYNAPQPTGILLDTYNNSTAFRAGDVVDCFTVSADLEGYLSDPYLPNYSESQPVWSNTVEASYVSDQAAICNLLYGISHPVDNVEHTLVWATNSGGTITDANAPRPTWTARAYVGKDDGGAAIDWGVPPLFVKRNYGYEWPWQRAMYRSSARGVVWQPYAPAILYRYNSAIRWSDMRQPQVIRGSSIEFVRDGDGDEIIALAPTYNGNLLVFKRNSIVRLMLAGGYEIARRDQVSDKHGIIGPHAWTSVGNYIIFVSHDGIYAYDDNSINQIDTPIRDEIFTRLSVNCNGIRDPLLQLVRVWYNKATNEVYINIPTYGEHYCPDYHIRGGVGIDEESIPLVGDVYVWNVALQVWTKLQYPSIVETNRKYPLVNSAMPSDVSGWLHHIRNYYADRYERMWSIPFYPSTIRDGGQLYLEGPHRHDTIWSKGVDDVFGEVSFVPVGGDIAIDPQFTRGNAPPHNIYRRQVRSLMSSPALKSVMTWKFKPRAVSVVGYWYRGMGNIETSFEWDGYDDRYDGGIGFEPYLLSVMGIRTYNQDDVTFSNKQDVVHRYLWMSDDGTYSYSLNLNAYRDKVTLDRLYFYEGGEFTFIPVRKLPLAQIANRGEEIILHAEAWGKFAFRCWHINIRQQENYLR